MRSSPLTRQTSRQELHDGLYRFPMDLCLEPAYLPHDQRFTGREELTWPYVAHALQPTLSKASVRQFHRPRICLGAARHLTQHHIPGITGPGLRAYYSVHYSVQDSRIGNAEQLTSGKIGRPWIRVDPLVNIAPYFTYLFYWS